GLHRFAWIAGARYLSGSHATHTDGRSASAPKRFAGRGVVRRPGERDADDFDVGLLRAHADLFQRLLGRVHGRSDRVELGGQFRLELGLLLLQRRQVLFGPLHVAGLLGAATGGARRAGGAAERRGAQLAPPEQDAEHGRADRNGRVQLPRTRLLLLLGDLPLSAADPVVEGAQPGRIAVAQAILGGVALLVGAGHEPGAEATLVLAGLRVLLERRAAPERHRQ